MSCPAIMKMCSVVSVLFLACVFGLFVNCEQYLFAGINAPYLNDSTAQGFISDCNANCTCEDLPFQPICGHDNVQYFSPCHAGCDQIYSPDASTEEYFNCSCIANSDIGTPDATSERCSTPGCPEVAMFYICFFIAMTFMFLCSSALITVVVRCVPNTHRSFAIGVQSLTPRLVAGPLGPFLFGVVIDDSCDWWDENGGACLWYNVPRLRLTLFILVIVLKLVSVVALVFGTWLYKAPEEEPIINDVIINGDATTNNTNTAGNADDEDVKNSVTENGISTISNGYALEENYNEIPPPYPAGGRSITQF